MNITLLAHTQLTRKAIKAADLEGRSLGINGWEVSDGQVVALAAIRQCYSHKTALEVLKTESNKYFGEKGKEGNRLFKQIVSSGHTSTLEHVTFTFAVENVSRSLLAQLTRHRHISFSVQSQRYVKLSSDSRSKGFDYVKPDKLDFGKLELSNHDEEKKAHAHKAMVKANNIFDGCMEMIQETYDKLIAMGVPQEDARSVLPNAASTNLVMTLNLRTALDFYAKRKPGNGAQREITVLADKIKEEIVNVESWTAQFFE